MGKLWASVLRITLEAKEPVRLGQYPGSALRGAFIEALLNRFCANPTAVSCQVCPLSKACPVTGLVAPLREEHPRGQDGPRPFVLTAVPPVALAGKVETPYTDDQLLEPGDCFAVDLTLLGIADKYFHYVMMSLPQLEDVGIGSRLRFLGGRRGRMRVRAVEAIDIEGAVSEILYDVGHRVAKEPSYKITPEAVAQRAEQFSTEHITLQFLTPTRMVLDGHLLKRPAFLPLILRLLERLEALEEAYGSADGLDPEYSRQVTYQRYISLVELVSQVTTKAERVSWIDLPSYSSRQRRVSPIGGFIGEVTYAGDLTPFRELLAWGEVVHVGKNVVKGDGHYRVQMGT